MASRDTPHSGYAHPIGIRVLTSLAENGKRLFTAPAFVSVAAEHDVNAGSARFHLTQLTNAGWIERIRRGLYVIRATALAPVSPHPFSIATQLVTPSAIAGWSALHFHQLTEQVPTLITAVTTKRVPTPSMREGNRKDAHVWKRLGLRIVYYSITPRRYIGIDEVWVNEFERVPIMNRERTVADLFLSPRRYGGIEEGLDVLTQHLHELNVPRLVALGRLLGSVAMAKRLGWALEHAGAPDIFLDPLRSLPTRSVHLLDPMRPARGRIVKEWSLDANS